jgi:small subunit ribosomal protein S6
MIRNYEGVFIFDAGLKEEDVEKRLKEICASVTSRKGEIIKQERLGKRTLAYSIRKHREGDYHILNFKAPSEIISAIKDEYKLIPSLIRFMIVKL